MIYLKGGRVVFEALRPCKLNGKRYARGDLIAIRLNRDWEEDEGAGEGGPWGWGAYTSWFVKQLGEEDYS